MSVFWDWVVANALERSAFTHHKETLGLLSTINVNGYTEWDNNIIWMNTHTHTIENKGKAQK